MARPGNAVGQVCSDDPIPQASVNVCFSEMGIKADCLIIVFDSSLGPTLEERHQLLSMMLDGVYVDMVQGLVLGLKPKPEFLPLFNLGEPVTTRDSELVTGGITGQPITWN